MQLVSFIKFAELGRLNSGHTMSDQLASTMQEYLALLKIKYVSPFACIGVLPDGVSVDASHPLHVYGDTKLLLRESIIKDLRLSCESDIQNTAKNALDHWKKSRKLISRPKVIDLDGLPVEKKFARLEDLASAWDNRHYPEVRIYRGLKWSDVDRQCAEQLKAKTLD